jgi:hypothetical protein
MLSSISSSVKGNGATGVEIAEAILPWDTQGQETKGK